MKMLVLSILVATISVAMPSNAFCQPDKSPAEIFESRIMPIFRSANPSSCVQCHLASVDLKDYILPSSEKTFVSLRDQGLIDLDKPESSKILKLIGMGDQDTDQYAKRIHGKMRKAEYEAFSQWIIASCKDDKLIGLPKSETERASPAASNEVIRYARKSRVVDSFERNVWSQRMRCFPCHTPNEIGPKQKVAKEKFDGWYEKYGDQMLIFKKTPEKTLRYLVEESKKTKDGHLPLLNLETPAKSLLVLKPMSKIPPKEGERRSPTYREPVYHMGGLKIHENDHSHKAFLNWIEDYAKTANSQYKTANELPSDNWFPTQRILRMKEVPESWEVGATAQMFVFAKNDRDEWSSKPVAFTQGTVTPRRILNGALIMLAPTQTAEYKKWKLRHNKLPPGDYKIKVFLDAEDQLADDPTALLTQSQFVGDTTIKRAKWRNGFQKAEWISGNELEN